MYLIVEEMVTTEKRYVARLFILTTVSRIEQESPPVYRAARSAVESSHFSQNPPVYAIFGQSKVSADVISGLNVKTIDGYVFVIFFNC